MIPPATSPVTPPTACPQPAPIRDRLPLRFALFLAFFGTMLVVLDCVVDDGAIDVTLIPRLLAALVVLLATVGVVCIPRVTRLLDLSVLREPLVACCGAYFIVTAGSLLVAANPSAGYTDVFRTFATFLTLCLSCLLLPTVPAWQKQLVRVLVTAGFVAATVGFQELSLKLGLGIHDRHSMEEVTGLMSGVNLYAGILAMLLPWCVCGIFTLGQTWRALSAAAAAAGLAMVVLLQSRAAWLAVLVSAATTIGLMCVGPPGAALSRTARRRIVLGFAAGLAGVVGLVATAPSGHPLAERFRSMVAQETVSDGLPREGGRLMVWGITGRMIADHPLTGVGAGNFTVRFHEYFGGDDLDFSNVHTNWVQPHNDFLWVFVEKGLPGILTFLGCFVAAGAAVRTILTHDVQVTDRRLTLAAAATLAGYATLSCFDFPLERINHQIHLAVTLAALTVIQHGFRPAAVPALPVLRGGWGWRLAVPLALAIGGLGIAYSRAAIEQEKQVILARRAWRQGKWEEMLAAARRARTPWKTLDPLVSPVAFLEGMAHVRLGDVEQGLACLERARVDNPNRMYVINNLGILYARTGRFEEAIECFSLAAHRYPHRIEPFNNLASCLLEAGYGAEALELLEQIPDEARTDAIRNNIELARELAHAEDAPTPDAEEDAEPAAPAP
jgi:O-antigen ligase